MILIADSGSTKTQWVIIDGKDVISDITTKGFNPYYYKEKELETTLYEELHWYVKGKNIEKVYFYGAGCSTKTNCSLVKNALQSMFPDADIVTGHDLYGAALSLFGKNEGIACILGTGSNSCMWDGEKITYNVPSLGYMLGDEGSGTYIGKLMLQKILYGDAGKELIEKFYDYYDLDFEKVLHKIYGSTAPNRFMASISLFVGENIHYEDCRNVVKKAFRDFIDTQLSKYPDYKRKTVSFTGSVAYHYKDILDEVLLENGINTGKVTKTPMQGLIEYYSSLK